MWPRGWWLHRPPGTLRRTSGWAGPAGSSKPQGPRVQVSGHVDNLHWPHTPWVLPGQERACCPGPVPAAIPWAMISDSIGEDRPPGMSQLAPVSYLLLKVGKTTLCTWQYLLLLVFLSSLLFFKKQKVTPVLTATKSILLAFCISHCNNNNPLHLVSLLQFTKHFLILSPFLVQATVWGGRESWHYCP